MKDKYITYLIIGVIVTIMLTPLISQSMSMNAVWNSILDYTNGRIRIKIEDYDSTANTVFLSDEAIANHVYDATTLAMTVSLVGDITFTGDLTPTGDFTLTGDMDVTGDSSLDGSLIVNDSGADKDTRIEGDTVTSLVHVDAGNDRIGFGTATPAKFFQAIETTAYTITSTNIADWRHATSGTPANNIGLNHTFAVETAADNYEVGAIIDVVAVDTTATSEDFDFVIKTMTAGATASDKVRVGSTEVVINEPSADVDFRVETDNVTDGMQVDAGTDSVIFGAGLKLPYTNVAAASYSIVAADKILGVSYTATAAVGVTLATAQTVDGRIIIIADTGANANTNNITIGTEGAETISGAATQTISADNGVVRVFSDGSNWFLW